MNPRRVVVGPVRTLAEARELSRAGATCIAVMVESVPGLDGGRRISLEEAVAIANNIDRDLCLLMDDQFQQATVEDALRRLIPRYIAFHGMRCDEVAFAALVGAYEAILIPYGLSLDYDEEPSWTLGAMESVRTKWRCEICAVSVMSGLHEPLEWLNTESGQYDEDLTLTDIQNVLNESVLLNLAVHRSDARWARSNLRSGQGWFFVLGDEGRSGRVPTFTTVDEVCAFLSDYLSVSE